MKIYPALVLLASSLTAFGQSVTFLDTFGSPGSGDRFFQSPNCVAANPATGATYVGDSGNDRVQQLDASGIFVRKWGTPGAAAGQFGKITGIAVRRSTGEVYVVDAGLANVHRFTSTGFHPILGH